jgi:hypothetical protein
MKTNHRLGVLGLVSLLPASILVSSGVLGFTVPSFLIHPVLVMGGLLIALVLNSISVFRVQGQRDPTDGFAVTLRIGLERFNWVVLAMAALLLVTIFGYLFVENFRLR